MTKIIEVSHLSKSYSVGHKAAYSTLRDAIAGFFRKKDDHEIFWALKDVSFSVDQGESVALVGNNGAGKSTLLKILARITPPTSGSGYIRGRVASLLEVGTGFHPELTGRENIFLCGSVLGMTRKEILAKFDEIVDFAEVEKFLDTPVKFYSSGMYVRLAFSVAAHLEPEILIVDEVLAVGDIRFQKKCLGKMNASTLSGRTVLYVSHNIATVRSFCSRAILLNHGQIEMDGKVEDVVSHYLQQFSSSSSVQTWGPGNGPGNYCCKFLKVRIANAQGEDMASVDLSDEFFVELTYEVIEEGAQLCFSLFLLSDEGHCAFRSVSNQEPKYYGKPMQKGVYVTRCRVPGDMLNNGTFRVTLHGHAAMWSDYFSLENVVSFDAHDDGVLKGDYHGGYSGFFRPKLEWSTVVSQQEPVQMHSNSR